MLARLKLRRPDNYGEGHFGASRGTRKHMGVDLECPPGASILAPAEGMVTKVGYPYGDDLSYQYVQITDDQGFKHRVFYVKPAVEYQDKVQEGDVIGTAQDLTRRYPSGMNNHIHYEIKMGRGYIDPTPYCCFV